MPSSIAHGFVAAAIGTAILPASTPRAIMYTGIASAVLLDVDAIGRPFGLGDIEWLGGHRALTHSLFFAVVLGAFLTYVLRRSLPGANLRSRAFAFFATAMAAHGVLDMFTDDHPAVAFLSPFTWQRFEAPWEPFQRIWVEVFIVWLPSWLFIRYAKHANGSRARQAR